MEILQVISCSNHPYACVCVPVIGGFNTPVEKLSHMPDEKIWALIDTVEDPSEVFAIGFASESHAQEDAEAYAGVEPQSFKSLDELHKQFSHQDLSWIDADEDELKAPA